MCFLKPFYDGSRCAGKVIAVIIQGFGPLAVLPLIGSKRVIDCADKGGYTVGRVGAVRRPLPHASK